MSWRPRIRYSLTTLLVAVTVICVWLGMIADEALKQRRAVEAVARLNGGAMFDYQFQPRGDITGGFELNRMPPGSPWARKLFGDDFFRTVLGLTIDGRAQLADSAALDAVCALRRLKLLFVERFALSDADVTRISRLPELEVLNLSSLPLTDSSLTGLALSRRLKSLTLARTQVTDAGLTHLAKISTLARLDLSCTQITGSGLAHLSDLPALEKLSLAETRINDRCVPHLRRLHHLERLDLWRTAISDEAASQLQASLPKCRVIWFR